LYLRILAKYLIKLIEKKVSTPIVIQNGTKCSEESRGHPRRHICVCPRDSSLRSE
jgi:hypothetical protein